MTRTTWAEDSAWHIPTSFGLDPLDVATLSGALTAESIADEVWRLHFEPGKTPTVNEMSEKMQEIARPLMLIAPTTLTLVEPMLEPDLTQPENDETIAFQPNGGKTL